MPAPAPRPRQVCAMPLGQGSEDPNRRQNRVSFTGAGDGAGSRSASYAVALAGSPQRRGSERQGSARSRANSGSLSRLPSAKGRLSRQASAISPALSRAVSGVLSEPDSDGEEQGWAAQVARWKLSVVKEGILEAEPQAARYATQAHAFCCDALQKCCQEDLGMQGALCWLGTACKGPAGKGTHTGVWHTQTLPSHLHPI